LDVGVVDSGIFWGLVSVANGEPSFLLFFGGWHGVAPTYSFFLFCDKTKKEKNEKKKMNNKNDEKTQQNEEGEEREEENEQQE